MNRVFFFIAFFVSNLVFANAESEVDVDSLKSYMKSLKNISADFIQVDRKGNIQSGKFYLSRPGKMRWEYQDPKQLIIVLNNEKIYYYDQELDQVSHYIGDYGMMNVLIEDDVFASKDVTMDGYNTDNDMTKVTF